MASNDLLLLNSLVEKSRLSYGPLDTDDEYFEVFCIDNTLKNYDISLEHLHAGWVDGPDDGGIDGLYVFVDGVVVSEEFNSRYVRYEPNIELYVFTIKSSESFRQIALITLLGTLNELLDLRHTENSLRGIVSTEILAIRRMFRLIYIELAEKKPSVKVNVCYCSKGDVSRVARNVHLKGEQLKRSVNVLFGQSSCNLALYGATEMLHLAQRKKRYSLQLPYVESFISRDRTNYVVLCPIMDYLAFITDEDESLRRYLFDGNVRDYLGDVSVNKDIASTLLDSQSEIDFWWLNNGVTILASNAIVIGKMISIDNVQIVNGLQTTETIYRTMRGLSGAADQRTILVKIIISTDDSVRERIIKATNYQNSVNLSSLRSIDQIQRDIEQYLRDFDWYYERRSNMYRNEGKPGDRILSIHQLGTAVRTLVFKTPRTAERRQKWLRNDNSYREVFNPSWPLDLFLACANISKSTENYFRQQKKSVKPFTRYLRLDYLVGLVSLVVACVRLRKLAFDVADLSTSLSRVKIADVEIKEAFDHVLEVRSRVHASGRAKVNKDLEKEALASLADNDFKPIPLNSITMTSLGEISRTGRKQKDRKGKPESDIATR